jgi:hypothetical protein
MINVLDKLKEIQENYDNEDIQRAIGTAAKMNPVAETSFDDPAFRQAVDVAVGGPEKRLKKAKGQTKARRGSFPSQNVRKPGEKDKTEDKDIGHDCATHFEHKKFGKGTVIPGEHTLSEAGEVSHYDAEFVKEDGSPFIVRNIPVANIQEIISEKHHSHKKKMDKCGQFDEEVVDEGFVDPDLQDILDRHEDAYMKFKAGAELYSLESFYDDLYDYFMTSGEMPYGTAKGRTGDPDQWIADYLDHMDDPYAVGESTVEEVHVEENNDLADIVKLAGRKSVLGLNQNVTIAESTELSEEDELEEAQSPAQKAAFEKMLAAKNGGKADDADDDADDADDEDEDPVTEDHPGGGMPTEEEQRAWEEKNKKKQEKDSPGYDDAMKIAYPGNKVKEEAIEETVEVPLSELADLLRLAGYENYEEKLSEYENDPEEKYFDVEDQLIGLAGGLNRPKTMHPTVAGGDNPMAVIPIKVDEADMFEKIYQNYQSFVKEEPGPWKDWQNPDTKKTTPTPTPKPKKGDWKPIGVPDTETGDGPNPGRKWKPIVGATPKPTKGGWTAIK